MARPPIPIGTYGAIAVVQVGPAKYKARAYYRSTDGKRHTMSRHGQTKAAARRSLGVALGDWQRQGAQPPAPEARVTEMAARWLETIAESDRADRTKEHYAYAVVRYVTPELGDLAVREVSTRLVDHALRRISIDSGPGAAKTARAVLNGIFGLAVRHGLLTVNPAREATPISPARKAARALTVAETEELTDALRTDQRATLLDLPDLVEWMLGTGARIGEALAARDAALDLDAGTWDVNATVVRLKGAGLSIQERPKTAAGRRVLALPPSMVAMVQRRAAELRLGRVQGVVFGSPHAKALRDPSNTAKDLREVLNGLGFGEITSHTFRKTVATRLDEAGWTARQIADHLGHAQPSMTMDVYMGRKVVNADAARVLER